MPGLSERFARITAQSSQAQGAPSLAPARSRKRRRNNKAAPKSTLASLSSAASRGIAKQRSQASKASKAQFQASKAEFQAELLARVAAAGGSAPPHSYGQAPPAWAWRGASGYEAPPWRPPSWHTPTARKLDLSGSTVTVRGGGRWQGGRGRGRGAAGGRAGGRGLAIKWRRPPSAEEQAALDAAESTRREQMDDDLDSYWATKAV